MHIYICIYAYASMCTGVYMYRHVAIVASGSSLRGFMMFYDFSDFYYAGIMRVFFPLFLRQTVSALWAFMLFNSIALLKSIMRDAGESSSPRRGAETSLR